MESTFKPVILAAVLAARAEESPSAQLRAVLGTVRQCALKDAYDPQEVALRAVGFRRIGRPELVYVGPGKPVGRSVAYAHKSGEICRVAV